MYCSQNALKSLEKRSNFVLVKPQSVGEAVNVHIYFEKYRSGYCYS